MMYNFFMPTPKTNETTLSQILKEVREIKELLLQTRNTEISSNDELFAQAKSLTLKNKKVSASMLQRKLKVGYARAARLLDELEEAGVIGSGDGAKPRKVSKK